jgi:hypothetical protein
MPSRRATSLHRLARTLTEQFALGGRRLGPVEAVYAASREWTFEWTDGPTVEQVRHAARQEEPEATAILNFVRHLSEGAMALGAVRLEISAATATRGRAHISAVAVHDFWRSIPLPCTDTERERRLVHAAIYQVRDNHHRNFADHQEICDEVAAGLAPLAQRARVALTPIETLTAQYAFGRDRAAWYYGLAPMPIADAFKAVCADSKASAEAIAAALTLLPDLPADTAAAAEHLRARQRKALRTMP